MTATLKLQAKMKECGYTIDGLAKDVGISRTALFNKIHNLSEFYVSEFEVIGRLLKMSATEKEEIFFAKV